MDSPSVGSVWGDPAKPETWKLRTDDPYGRFVCQEFGDYCQFFDWSDWLASSGAVDITELVARAIRGGAKP